MIDVALNVRTVSLEELHQRFGHLNHAILTDTVKSNSSLKVVRVGEEKDCRICLEMKAKKRIVLSTYHPSLRILYRIHTDIVVLPVRDSRQNLYWITFIDEWSRWIEIVLVKSKDDYVVEVQRLVERWENEHQISGAKVAQIRSDESLIQSKSYVQWCKQKSIIAEASPAL